MDAAAQNDLHYWLINRPGRPNPVIPGDRVLSWVATSSEAAEQMLVKAHETAKYRAGRRYSTLRLFILLDTEVKLSQAARALLEEIDENGRAGGVVVARRTLDERSGA